MGSKHDEVKPGQPALVLLYGNQEKKPRSLDRDALVIGRARGCDISLEAPDVSNLHCIITRTWKGFRLRDCGSRAGTKVNGEAVQSTLLHDDDVLQIGPFSFRVSIPAKYRASVLEIDPRRWQHLEQSRQRLAKIALRMRNRFHKYQGGAGVMEEEQKQKAAGLRERIRSYDQKLSQLEEAERELEEEKNQLSQEREAHRGHVEQVEADLARRLHETEAEIQKRWQEFQKRCQEEEKRQLRSLQDAKPFTGTEEAKRVCLERFQEEWTQQQAKDM